MGRKEFIRRFKGAPDEIRANLMKMGLKKKIVLFAMCTFVGAALCTFLIFGMAYNQMWRQAMTSHIKSAGAEKEKDIYDYFNSMDELAYNICYSNWLQDLFRNSVSVQRRQELEENAWEFLGSLSTLYEGNQLAVIALNGTKITSRSGNYLDYDIDITKKEWYPQLLENGKYVETGVGQDKGIYRNKAGWNINIYYVVKDYNTLNLAGFMVIIIPIENINKLLATGYEEISFELRGESEIIASFLPEELSGIPEQYSKDVSKVMGRYYVSHNKLNMDYVQWELITALDTENQNIDGFMLVLILAGMLLLLVSLLLIAAMVV